MFVRDVVQIEYPFEAVAPCFLRHPAWLEPLVSSAVGEASARCQRGIARRRADSLVVPMRWTVDHEKAFPSLDGDLTITPAGPARSQVSLEATCALGRGDDPRQITESAVQVAVRAFLEGLAATFADQVDRLADSTPGIGRG